MLTKNQRELKDEFLARNESKRWSHWEHRYAGETVGGDAIFFIWFESEDKTMCSFKKVLVGPRSGQRELEHWGHRDYTPAQRQNLYEWFCMEAPADPLQFLTKLARETISAVDNGQTVDTVNLVDKLREALEYVDSVKRRDEAIAAHGKRIAEATAENKRRAEERRITTIGAQ